MAWVGGSYISIGTKEAIMVSWWWLIFTSFGGAVVGLFMVCLCVAAGNADDEMDRIHDQFPEEGHF